MQSKKNTNKNTRSKVYDKNKILSPLYKQSETYNPIAFTFDKTIKGSSLCELDRIRQYSDKKHYESEIMLAFWLAVHTENLQIAKFILTKNSMIKKLVQASCGQLNPKQVDLKEEDNTQSDTEKSNCISQSNVIHDDRSILGNTNVGKQVESSDYSYKSQTHTIFELPPNYKSMTIEQRKKFQEEFKKKLQMELIDQTMQMNMNSFTVLKQHQKMIEPLTGRIPLSSRLNPIIEEGPENIEFDTRDDLRRFKNDLKIRFHQLMTQILKSALLKGEEILASVISIYYSTNMDMDTLKQAVEEEKFHWIYNLWAFQKNYTGTVIKQKLDVITYNSLFDLIITYFGQDRAYFKIKDLCSWHLITDDNLLIALINHKLDELAIEFMGIYKSHVDKDLFIFCLDIGNTDFLQTALTLNAFDYMIFRETEVMNKIIYILREGHRTNFLLNVLCLSDIAIFKIKHIQQLILVLHDYIQQKYEKNCLLLCSNPLLAICLAAELTDKIRKTRRLFANDCKMIKAELMKLGNMYASKIQEEKYYEKLVFDTDITGRSVLKIITSNSLDSLMDENDAKSNSSLLKLWDGKEASKCDGYLRDFSSIVHLLTSKSKRIISNKGWILNLISNGFEANLKVDYQIQYKYRQKQISFYYLKEFICAILMLILFQIVNYRLITLNQIDFGPADEQYASHVLQVNANFNMTGDYQAYQAGLNKDNFYHKFIEQVIQSKIASFYSLIIVSCVFSGALLAQSILKIVFNLCTDKLHISIDKWTISDTVCGLLNLTAHILYLHIEPSNLVQFTFSNNALNYFMIFVLVVTWIRFFLLLMLHRIISKTLLIIKGVLIESLSFLLLLAIYLLIVASIFTVVFREVKPDEFGDLGLSFRVLFDTVLGSYNYEIDHKRIALSILLGTHALISHVILLNYLIAILVTSYNRYRCSGVFNYKCNMFSYSERYMVALEDNVYGQLIMHPPPLNYLAFIFALPMAVSKSASQKCQKFLSYMTFWIENIIMALFFVSFEILILPLAYVKVLYNFYSTNSDFLFLTVCASVWVLLGPLILLCMICIDLFFLLKILSMHQGCRDGLVDELEEEIVDDKKKIQIFNEIRESIITLYEKIKIRIDTEFENESKRRSSFIDQKFSMSQFQAKNSIVSDTDFVTEAEGETEKQLTPAQIDDIDYYKVSDLGVAVSMVFIISKKMIIKEWKKRRSEKFNRQEPHSVKNKFIKLQNTPQHSKVHPLQKNKTSVGVLAPNVFKSRTMLANKIKNEQPPSPMLSSARKSLYMRDNSLKKHHKRHQMLEKFLEKQGSLYENDEEIAEEDIKIANQILQQFTIVSESSSNDHLDIELFLKALPSKINFENIEKVSHFNFKIFQEALIAYQNIFIVNAFEYFDDKNRERTVGLREKLIKHKGSIVEMSQLMSEMHQKFERNQDVFLQMSEVAQASENKQQLIKLLKLNRCDDYYGDKMSKLDRLVAALQRQAASCVEQQEREKNEEIQAMKKFTLIEVQNMDGKNQSKKTKTVN